MSIVDPCCIDVVHFLSFSILYNRNCKMSSLKCKKKKFSRRMCWRIYKVHNVVYWANSKVNHLISPDFKRIDGHRLVWLYLNVVCLRMTSFHLRKIERTDCSAISGKWLICSTFNHSHLKSWRQQINLHLSRQSTK